MPYEMHVRIIQMKSLILITIVGLFLLQSAEAQCATGYYNDTTLTPPKCSKCVFYLSECSTASGGATAAEVVLHPKLKGYTRIATAPFFSAHCSLIAYYNPTSTYCDITCAYGCKQCIIDNNFCYSCTPGFYFSASDMACYPVGVGLNAASLALLIIAFFFLIGATVAINKARK